MNNRTMTRVNQEWQCNRHDGDSICRLVTSMITHSLAHSCMLVRAIALFSSARELSVRSHPLEPTATRFDPHHPQALAATSTPGAVMLQFIGNSTSNVVSECVLDQDELTIGRDAKCRLLLDSIVSPRMISRVHARINRTQPPSAATTRNLSKVAPAQRAVSPHTRDASLPMTRWILTDEKSMNGVFVNDIKVSSTILAHNDIITIGGLGQKVPLGTTFPQPEAEFIFRFLQYREPEQTDEATLPMAPHEAEEDSQKTQPRDGPAHEEHDEHEEERRSRHRSSSRSLPQRRMRRMNVSLHRSCQRMSKHPCSMVEAMTWSTSIRPRM
jgi:pSer/pThr/pTyr-binding forkhead associated (FHA) protein